MIKNFLPLLLGLAALTTAAAADPLPSWNETATKQAIVAFVEKVTTEGSPDFVPPAERIATFDNDGTLWSEKPLYFQLLFAIDRVKALAPDHPEWKTEEPFASLLKGDLKGVFASGKEGLLKMVVATHTGMTVGEFSDVVSTWMKTARHPETGKPYPKMSYQPMLELLDYLRAHGFKTYIVSGGNIEFMRPWVEKTYGIPPEQVVGSNFQMKYEVRNGQPVLVQLAEISRFNNEAAKPVAIQNHIGRRPLMVFGNSDGDFEMLEWTTAVSGPRFGAFVHHTDAKREWAYDRNSSIGQLSRGLDEAPQRGWTLIDMKDDWKTVFAP